MVTTNLMHNRENPVSLLPVHFQQIDRNFADNLTDWNKVTKLKFDLRSVDQISSNDMVSTPDYWAVFEYDKTTCYKFNASIQDRIAFSLADRSKDQSFDKIFYRSWDTNSLLEFDQFSVSIANTDGVEFLCSAQQSVVSEGSKYITCANYGIELIFQALNPVKSHQTLALCYLQAWSYNKEFPFSSHLQDPLNIKQDEHRYLQVSPNQPTDPTPCHTEAVSAQGSGSIYVFDGQTSFGGSLSASYTANGYSYSCGSADNLSGFSFTGGINVFQLDASGNIQAQSSSMSQIGNKYGTGSATLITSSYDGSVTFNRTISAQFTLTVLDPCPVTSFQISPSPLALSCSVEQTACQITVSVNTAVDSSQGQTLLFCGGVTFVSINDSTSGGVAALQTSSELILYNSGQITVFTMNAATVGSHSVTLTIKLSSYPAVTQDFPINLNITPCVLGSITAFMYNIVPPSLHPMTYVISKTQPFSLQLQVTPVCTQTVSDWEITSTIVSGSHPEVCQVNAQTGLFSIAQNLPFDRAGVYTITITGVKIGGIQQGNNLVPPSAFLMTVVDPCSQTTVYATTIPQKSLKVWEGSPTEIYNIFADFTDSASTAENTPGMCAISYTTTITQNGSGFSLTTFQNLTQGFNIYSDNMLQRGNYTVTVRGSVDQYPSRFAESTFVITITDPCLTTTINSPTPPIAKMTTSIKVATGAITQQVVFNDSVSVTHGNGVDVCGARSYSITSTPNPTGSATPLVSSQLFIGSRTGVISLQSSVDSDVGIHTATVNVILANYPGVTAVTSTFQIEIQPCKITSFTMVSPTQQNYTIASSALSWSFIGSSLTNQVPACGYAETISLRPATVPSFVVTIATGSTITFIADTRNRTLNQTYSITFINTLVGYTYTPVPSIIGIQTLKAIDPCQSTVVNGPHQVYNLVQFAGFSLKSNISYTFNDTISQALTHVTDEVDYCGDKIFSFELNNATTNYLTGNNSRNITLSVPSDQKTFGVQNATLKVCMKDYPQLCKSVDFNVTMLGVQLPTIATQQYTIGSSLLNIKFDEFEILPQNQRFSHPLVKTMQAYYIADNQSPINSNSIGLTQISNQTWITFSTNTSSLSVQSDDRSLDGNYAILLAQSFDQFPGVSIETYFKLKIIAPPIRQKVDLTPRQRTIKMDYLIGGDNQPLQLLKNYKFKLSSEYNIIFKAIQTSGIPIKSQAIDSQYQFSIKVDDTNYIDQEVKFQISVTTDLPDQIPNEDMIIQVFFQEVKINYQFSVQTKRVWQKTKSNSTQEKSTKQNVAQITSITQTGLVTIKFSQPLFVPQFKQSVQNTNSSATNRLLQSNETELTLEQYIDKQILKVTQVTKQGMQTIEWVCKNFTQETLLIQLLFKNPLEVSSFGFDQILVKFLAPDYFVLYETDGYLFTQEDQTILTAQIPPQFPSEKALVAFTQVSKAISNSAPQIIVISLLLQIIAKKVISSMFIYYSALQIILLINLEANVQLPSSVNLLTDTIDGIINLSSLDKKSIAQKLKLPESTFQDKSLMQKLSGVSIAILVILLFVCAIFIIRRFNIGEKLKALAQKIVKMIFWNFLIRYFQVAFINLNFSFLTSVKTTDSLFEMIFSIIIVLAMYALVCFLCSYLLSRTQEYLCQEETKKSIGNLYLNLDTVHKTKRFYGAMFFIQRAIIVLIIALKYDFGAQFVSLQLVFMFSTIYLIIVKPYTQWADARVDYYNTTLLLMTEVFFTLTTPYVTDTAAKYQYGIYFGVLVGFGLVTNMIYIVFLAIKPLELKFKRYLYRKKHNKGQKGVKLGKIVTTPNQAAIIAQNNLKRVNNESQISTYDTQVQVKPQSWLQMYKAKNQVFSRHVKQENLNAVEYQADLEQEMSRVCSENYSSQQQIQHDQQFNGNKTTNPSRLDELKDFFQSLKKSGLDQQSSQYQEQSHIQRQTRANQKQQFASFDSTYVQAVQDPKYNIFISKDLDQDLKLKTDSKSTQKQGSSQATLIQVKTQPFSKNPITNSQKQKISPIYADETQIKNQLENNRSNLNIQNKTANRQIYDIEEEEKSEDSCQDSISPRQATLDSERQRIDLLIKNSDLLCGEDNFGLPLKRKFQEPYPKKLQTREQILNDFFKDTVSKHYPDLQVNQDDQVVQPKLDVYESSSCESEFESEEDSEQQSDAGNNNNDVTIAVDGTDKFTDIPRQSEMNDRSSSFMMQQTPETHLQSSPPSNPYRDADPFKWPTAEQAKLNNDRMMEKMEKDIGQWRQHWKFTNQ